MNSTKTHLASRLALVLIAAGILINLGWLLEVPVLTGATFGLSAAPSSAILFMICGFCVMLKLRLKSPATAYALAAFVVLFAAAIFVHRTTGMSMLVERWFRPSF